MNERIKQLAEQAGINKDAFQFSGTPIKHIVDEPSLKKFAELLIEDNIQTLINNGYTDAAKCLHDVHFGIDDAP